MVKAMIGSSLWSIMSTLRSKFDLPDESAALTGRLRTGRFMVRYAFNYSGQIFRCGKQPYGGDAGGAGL